MNGKKSDFIDDCTCDETRGDLHSCPFDEDVNNNPDSSCDCCASCEYECARSI